MTEKNRSNPQDTKLQGRFFLQWLVFALLFSAIALGIATLLGASHAEYHPSNSLKVGLLSLLAVTVSYGLFFVEIPLRLNRKKKLLAQPEEKPPFFIRSSLDKVLAFGSRCIPAIAVIAYEGGNLSSIGLGSASMFDGVVVGGVLGLLFLIQNGNSFAPSKYSKKQLEPVYRNLITVTGEEVLIRGFLQLRLIAWLGFVPGLLIASLVFAVMHYPGDRFLKEFSVHQAWINTSMTFPLGLMTGVVFYVSGSLLAAILFHLAINLAGAFPRKN